MNTIYVKNEVRKRDCFRVQYTIKEAAKMLSVSERTVEYWIEKLGLQSYQIGGKGKRFIANDDLIAFVERYRAIQGLTSTLPDLKPDN